MNNNISNNNSNINDVCFVIIRHINSEETNKYWITCYSCIRTYYPDNFIIIIDDNSIEKYITSIKTTNCLFIQSEFPQRGEILGYYYYHKYKLANNAFIIHDSMFINSKINFDNYINDKIYIKFLFYFRHHYNNEYEEKKILNYLCEHDDELKNQILKFYEKKEMWNGCFGVQSFINYNFLNYIYLKYNLFNLLHIIKCREDRCHLERVFGVITLRENILLQYTNGFSPIPSTQNSIFGDIEMYCNTGRTYNEYINGGLSHLPIIKVWTGR